MAHVLWRERLRAGRAVLNGKVVGAFATAVVLHVLWDTFNLLGGYLRGVLESGASESPGRGSEPNAAYQTG